MSLSLAWVTPFSAASDISAFSHGLLLEFSRLADTLDARVSLFVQENGPSFWSELPTIALTGTATDREMLLSYDFVVFNIGNNLPSHGLINRLALDVPGVVIVHDLVMHHAVAGMLGLSERDERKRSDVYALLMGEYYGVRGLGVVSESRLCVDDDPVYAPWDTSQVTSFALIEPFLHTAAAVVVHSVYAEAAIPLPARVPVLRLGLPWDQKPSPSGEELEDWWARTAAATTCEVVCIGHISRNKCLEQVALAFARSPLLRERARLTIAGHPGDTTYLAELRRMAAQLDLEKSIEFALGVSDEQLQKIKRQADIFVNLRHPNTESASGSLTEQLNSGKPVVVYPSGAYGEIDADAVIQVERGEGVAGLVTAMEGAVLDARARVRIGGAGRAFVRKIGREAYVRQLWAFLRANRDLLRARKACTAGRRAVPAVSTEAVGAEWLAKLNRARRLFARLGGGPLEMDALPFREWSDKALALYVAAGVFRQAPASKLEALLQAQLPGTARADWYDAVAQAHIVWRASEDTALQRYVEMPMLLPRAWLLLSALGRWAMVRCCYLGLLGRAAEAREIAFHVSQAASGTVSGVLTAFLDSEEFVRRRVERAGVDALREWFVNNDQGTGDIAILRQGEAVAFTAANPGCADYFGPGWYGPETNGTWSRSSNATLLFGTDSAGARLRLTITGRLISAAGAMRRLTIRVNGREALACPVEGADWITVPVEIGRAADTARAQAIDFDCGHTVSPREAGYSNDNRQMGFCLIQMVLSDWPETEA